MAEFGHYEHLWLIVAHKSVTTARHADSHEEPIALRHEDRKPIQHALKVDTETRHLKRCRICGLVKWVLCTCPPGERPLPSEIPHSKGVEW